MPFVYKAHSFFRMPISMHMRCDIGTVQLLQESFHVLEVFRLGAEVRRLERIRTLRVLVELENNPRITLQVVDGGGLRWQVDFIWNCQFWLFIEGSLGQAGWGHRSELNWWD